MLPRFLPPTATPLPPGLLARSLAPPSDAQDRLRASLAETLGIEQCYFASTGRTALYLMLAALREKADDGRRRVVLPAYTCPSLVKVILEAQLQPRLVDISPTSMVMNPQALADACDETALALIVVHPFGIPHDMEAAKTVAQAAGAVVIEDVAQSMGARVGPQYAGRSGHYGLFSLGPGKPLSAGGGGILCVNESGDAGLIESAWQQLPTQGRLADMAAMARLAAFQGAFQPSGWWVAQRAGAQRVGDNEANWGFALTGLTTAQAAVATEQLPRLASYNRRRRQHAEVLMAGLGPLPGVAIPTAAAEDDPIYLRLPLLFKDADACSAVHEALQNAGIGAGRMYKRTLASIFPTLGGNFSGAEAVADGLLTLPTHHHLREEELARMTAIVRAGVL